MRPDLLQARLPPGLTVDTHQGAAYLGLVPFHMQRVRPRGLPPLPGLSWFLEFNVRTYVRDRLDRPGVWFFSLDCNQPLAVLLARRAFHLPYEHAAMTARTDGDACDFTSRRRGSPAPADRFTWSAPRTGGRLAPTGSLEAFLIERYRLFTARPDGTLLTGIVRHAPYRLVPAEVRSWSAHAATLAGFALEGPPVSFLATATVDVAIHALQPVDPLRS